MIESLNFFLPLLWSLTHLRQDPFQVGADEVRQGLNHLLQGCQGAEQVDLTRDQLAGASHGCQQWRHQAGMTRATEDLLNSTGDTAQPSVTIYTEKE